MGIVSQRRRMERLRIARRRLMIAAGIVLLASLAMTPKIGKQLPQWLDGFGSLPVFESSAQAEMTLPKRELYALQLGVFDSGERAAAQVQRLQSEGVRCVVWQSEKMRIVSCVALSREALDRSTAKGSEVYVIRETLPKVNLRIEADAGRIARVQQLLETPDAVLMHLLTREKPLEELIDSTMEIAKTERAAHPEHALYTQLADSLSNWCSLMEKAMRTCGAEEARNYAAVTICTLCRELRLALESQASAASTASAQRTPSTAADVMPPA